MRKMNPHSDKMYKSSSITMIAKRNQYLQELSYLIDYSLGNPYTKPRMEENVAGGYRNASGFDDDFVDQSSRCIPHGFDEDVVYVGWRIHQLYPLLHIDIILNVKIGREVIEKGEVAIVFKAEKKDVVRMKGKWV